MSASFVEELMKAIIETAMIPKVQVERSVGLILGMFLESVLTETFRDDPILSGSIKMICPEFPLKKPDNNQSTNIDWLMYNPERRQLLFIELKTSDTSIDASQNSIYLAKQETIQSEGGSFLITDLEQFRKASKERGKYQYILEKVERFGLDIAECHDARIVYLVPKSAEHKVLNYADKVLNFSMLPPSIPGPFTEEWIVVHCFLGELDKLSQKTRNLKSSRSKHLSVRR